MTEQQGWAKNLAEQSSAESLRQPTNKSSWTFDLASAIDKASADKRAEFEHFYGKQEDK